VGGAVGELCFLLCACGVSFGVGSYLRGYLGRQVAARAATVLDTVAASPAIDAADQAMQSRILRAVATSLRGDPGPALALGAECEAIAGRFGGADG